MTLKSLNTFLEIAAGKPKKKIAVAAAEDQPVLEAVSSAYNNGIIEPILVGNEKTIKEISEKINFSLKGITLINETAPVKSSKICVELIREDKAQIIMKGMVNTADYLRAILDKDNGLRSGNLLSHIGFFETKSYHKLLALTDAAQNIAPTLEEKIDIINNAVNCYHKLGVMEPKIAAIAAVETVNPKMEATIHAALLTMMNKRKQIKGCIIDGPLGFDNAVSKEAAEHKGIKSDVAGDADLLFAPNIEVGNAIYKSFTYFGNATVAAIMLGAIVPVVLTSRTDTESSKLMSISLAASY